MLEVILTEAERNHNFLKVLVVAVFITLGISFVNSYLGGISIFLVAFISLALSYPVTKYSRDVSKVISESFLDKSFTKRYKSELGVFLALFVGVVFGMYISNTLGFTTDFSYEKSFVTSLEGNITSFNTDLFSQILFNNLFVAFNTFIISTLFFSALIFVIIWNASILAYYLFSLNSHTGAFVTSLNLIIHALFEIGGYVLAGILGAVISYRMSIYFFGYGELSRTNQKRVLNKVFAKDCLVLLFLCIVFIFLGSVIEVL
ncbi:MAG: stage II sporulation protein M [Nanoarchaeales archaeon]|nr:stage II sporulation protein M [Nanoarchaeales archaeon]